MPAIDAMQRASLPDTYGPFLGRATVGEFIGAGNVERYFGKHWPDATVATVDGQIVGVVVLLGPLGPDTGLAKLAMRKAVLTG